MAEASFLFVGKIKRAQSAPYIHIRTSSSSTVFMGRSSLITHNEHFFHSFHFHFYFLCERARCSIFCVCVCGVREWLWARAEHQNNNKNVHVKMPVHFIVFDTNYENRAITQSFQMNMCRSLAKPAICICGSRHNREKQIFSATFEHKYVRTRSNKVANRQIDRAPHFPICTPFQWIQLNIINLNVNIHIHSTVHSPHAFHSALCADLDILFEAKQQQQLFCF